MTFFTRTFTQRLDFPESMDTKTRELLLVCAQKARLWTEENYSTFCLYDNMMGMCAIASGRLWMLLKQQGITARLMMAELPSGLCHVFVEYCGAIIDVTATQFNKEEIVIKDIGKTSEWFWDANYVFKDVLSLRLNQIDTQWTPSQIAVVFEDLDE